MMTLSHQYDTVRDEGTRLVNPIGHFVWPISYQELPEARAATTALDETTSRWLGGKTPPRQRRVNGCTIAYEPDKKGRDLYGAGWRPCILSGFLVKLYAHCVTDQRRGSVS